MHPPASRPRDSGAIVLGVVFVLVGAAALSLRSVGFDFSETVEGAGWPAFVILPGIVLAVLSVLSAPPRGLGLAIAGTIVTTVGLVLLYQDSTAHWESWAYAWALVGPGAAGVACLWYGTVTRTPGLVSVGFRLAVIGFALFALGAWYFETVFQTGRVPFDLGAWLPVLVIAVGALIVVVGLPSRGATNPVARSD